VADQVEVEKAAVGGNLQQSAINNSESPMEIEHIVQDGGTPGIVEFVAVLTTELGLTILPSHEGESLRASKPGYMLVLVSEADHGMYDAINRGIARMTGDLWAWLNCDEQYLPGTLPYAAEWFATHQEIDILCGDALLVDGEGRALSYRRIVPPQWLHTRLVHLSSLSCAAFYRRSVIARGGGFDTTWRSIGDAEWMARLLKAGLRVEVCHRLLSSFAFTGQNTSESPLACQEAARWRKSPDAPPSWMKVPVTIHHRMRRFLAGAYQYRSFSFSLYRNGGGDRMEYMADRIGWNWPGGENDGKLEKASVTDPSDFRVSGSVLGIPTVRVLGCDLAVTSYADLSQKLITYTRDDSDPLVVDFANTHVITLRCHDVEFAAWSKSSDITAPDGMPLVWVMNRRGAVLEDRVYGPTFTREFLTSCPPDRTHYLVGGSVECGEKFRIRMLALNPSLKFVGSYHGRCDAGGVLQDDQAVLREIREKRPDFIWVGLGAPKQYAWIHRIKPRIERGVILAVGFAFDVNAGMKLDTPAWMQRLGLGWLHRMASEPKRLVGRYLKYNSLFLWYLMRDGNKERKNMKVKERKIK
jgi:N-acetylglucosaminyldiphosphoundecaprenol N-acetyl-beta-D-mannosaminyltransferase